MDTQAQIFYKTIALNSKAKDFLRGNGYPNPKSNNELVAMLTDYAKKNGQEGLFTLCELHPNKEVFQAKYNTFSQESKKQMATPPVLLATGSETPTTTPIVADKGLLSDSTVKFVVLASMVTLVALVAVKVLKN